ncbi:MAG: hypothetical protein M1823_000691 [Watsoniomyces obsoletus]|nr:MAG: hypothetical protein M1823_000691 [Watsoniomyces obsoletus]
MRLPRPPRPGSAPPSTSNMILLSSLALLLFPTPITASTYDCKSIVLVDEEFNLSPLGGPYSIWHFFEHPPTPYNTTYTLDICRPLERTKNVPKENECRSGTRVCAIERYLNENDGDKGHPRGVIPIAGDYAVSHGRALDAKWTRLNSEKKDEDEKQGGKEGLKVEMHGGRYPFEDKHGRKQKAVIEFLCDRERTGLEGLVGRANAKTSTNSSGLDNRQRQEKEAASIVREKDDEEDDDDGDHDAKDPNRENAEKSLRFISYEPDEKDLGEDTLRLEWRTKYACEGMQNGDIGDKDGDSEESNSRHWGFFTWFIIM